MSTNIQTKPFVKWAGGKRQLLPELDKRVYMAMEYPSINTYVEPFIGGGATFFHVMAKYGDRITHPVINDLNRDLMVAYTAVRANPEALIYHLTELEKKYLSMDETERKAFYLKTREFFNEKVTDMIDSSAMFIFLNKTCFNGL